MNILYPSLLALLIPVAQAQEIAPDVLVKSISQEVIAVLKQDKDIQAGNPKKVEELIETKVLPHFNFTRMTRIAMGRNWRVATPEQQKELTGEFRTLLVRTYSTALSNYRDQQIDYKPLRAKPEDVEVTVRSEVKQSGSSQPVAIDYEMEKTPDGWKVYDVKVGGVSLVTTYRDTFSSEVKERGVDGLIKSLAAKNRQGERERAKSGKT
ncbi:MAG: ABC transporter substrate-binding protein [Betaproteobacteria bacterium]|nr:MAG: ABC transporter substrate-binding protein [Betaproteobacteria bacterium]